MIPFSLVQSLQCAIEGNEAPLLALMGTHPLPAHLIAQAREEQESDGPLIQERMRARRLKTTHDTAVSRHTQAREHLARALTRERNSQEEVLREYQNTEAGSAILCSLSEIRALVVKAQEHVEKTTTALQAMAVAPWEGKGAAGWVANLLHRNEWRTLREATAEDAIRARELLGSNEKIERELVQADRIGQHEFVRQHDKTLGARVELTVATEEVRSSAHELEETRRHLFAVQLELARSTGDTWRAPCFQAALQGLVRLGCLERALVQNGGGRDSDFFHGVFHEQGALLEQAWNQVDGSDHASDHASSRKRSWAA